MSSTNKELSYFNDENIYSLKKLGSFGVFYSGKSFPIEFVMTSFSIKEIDHLTLAKDIKLKKEIIDFNLLMQRDIDEDRIKTEVAPYLKHKDDESKSVFFPPILAAIVPIRDQKMEMYYSDEKTYIHKENNLIREWKDLFKITYIISSAVDSQEISCFNKDKEKTESVKIAPVQFEAHLPKGTSLGINLVVIDGQHRVKTIKNVLRDNPDIIKNLNLPVCIVFPPQATKCLQDKVGNNKIPPVTDVFRHLFVDVNQNAKRVGGHFNILLSDNQMGSLVCRAFCDHVINEHKSRGLAVIEWNQKTPKNANVINKPYSISSIGVINNAFERNMNQSRLKRLMNLEEIKDELQKGQGDDDSTIKWDSFSFNQKKALSEQIKKRIVPCLDKIIFQSDLYKSYFEYFSKRMDSLEELINSDEDNISIADSVFHHIISYKPLPKGRLEKDTEDYIKNFKAEIKESKKQSGNIGRYTIFQQAVFDAWFDCLDITEKLNVDIFKVTEAFIYILNKSTENSSSFYKTEQSYMQHIIFKGEKIYGNRQDTRIALSHLIKSFMGKKDIAKEFINILGKNTSSGSSLLTEFGYKSAEKHIELFRKYIQKDFINGYKTMKLNPDQKQDLSDAQEKLDFQKNQLRNKEIKKDEISNRFYKLVEEHVAQDVSSAENDLKQALGYDSEIMSFDPYDDEDTEEMEA